MNTEEKWQAVCRCDANYDGMFWYGVKSTGIFCNPSCKSRRPKKNNIVYFDSPQETMDARLPGLQTLPSRPAVL